jgi:deazaflavin-dependent oxidoreductase (nitroreductase family)
LTFDLQQKRKFAVGIINFDWSKIKNVQKLHRVLYAIGLGPVIGQIILLLTTTGRKSGQTRITPLQYEKIDDLYYLGAARGLKADWVRNIQANPVVDLQVGAKKVHGQAEVISEPAKMADFIEVRLQRHPFMIGLIMRLAHGLPAKPTREQLEAMSANETLVIIHPQK